MQTTTNTTKARDNQVADLLAGMTTGVANIPDAMASAVLAGANPVQGLYAIMIGTSLGGNSGDKLGVRGRRDIVHAAKDQGLLE